MSNLENLTAKILADGEKKAKTIVDNAKRDGESLIAKAEAEANAEGVKAIAAAEDEAKKLIELALSAKKIEIRDKGLAAKQSTIAKALDAAKQKLSGMDQNAYEGFLWRYLNETSFSAGETLRVPEKYAGLDMDALNKKLTAAGKPALA
ncbi:MAG: V-type ATP synthase subunit E, partial [Clostridiales bacterium]|nr:V-type ATP synthase subunit E [Clostridiales bacterium]